MIYTSYLGGIFNWTNVTLEMFLVILSIILRQTIGILKECHKLDSKVKVGVLCPVQQPGSYWDRSSELPLVGLEPTEVTAYD